jgi:hypothetical protein
MMKLKDLKPAGYNPRKISDEKLAMLKKSLAEFSDLSGVVFNIRTQTLICGHQRIKNFDPEWPITKKSHKDKTGTVALGYIETPFGKMQYREVDWPEDKEKKANIAANKHGGDFDYGLLKNLMDELESEDFDVELTGFSEKEIETMFGAKTEKQEIENKETVFQVLITCKDETEQGKLTQRLEKEGYKCRILMY